MSAPSRARRRQGAPPGRARTSTPVERPAHPPPCELSDAQKRALHVLVSVAAPVAGSRGHASQLGPPAEINETAAWELVLRGYAYLAGCVGEHEQFAATDRGRQKLALVTTKDGGRC